eukprot:12569771-Heterocapsa_arctica.AAC.1
MLRELEDVEEDQLDPVGIDSHGNRSEKRKAKHRVGNDGQQADTVKRFRAKSNEKSRAMNSEV